MSQFDNREHVVLWKGGEKRISNSAQEAEQLRRQGWNEQAPPSVSSGDDKSVAELVEAGPLDRKVEKSAAAVAERNFRDSITPELEGENVTPTNPSGAVVPPDVQRMEREKQAMAEFKEIETQRGNAHRNVSTGKGAVFNEDSANAVMGTRNAVAATPESETIVEKGQRVQAPRDADDEALPNDFPGRDVLMRNALTTPRMVRAHGNLDTLEGLKPADVKQIRSTLKIK